MKEGICRRVSRSKKFLMMVSATVGVIFILIRMSQREYGGVIFSGNSVVSDD